MEDMMNDDTMNKMKDLSTSSFCKTMDGAAGGGGMTMYMSGFQSTLIDSSSKTCLNLYISSWTLDTLWKFLFAMIFVLCLGTSLDGLAWFKRKYLLSLEEKHKKFLHDNDNHVNNNNTQQSDNNDDDDDHNDHQCYHMDDHKESFSIMQVKVVLLIFQFLQALIGYILMLSAMTYSIELLLSAIFGLTLGSHLFGKHNMMFSQNQRVTRSSSSISSVLISSSGILDQFDESHISCHDISNDTTSFFGSSSQRKSSIRNNGFDYIAINDNEDAIEDARQALVGNDEERCC